MDGTVRREHILQDLQKSQSAIKGSSLAKAYGVSRQVIVQDIALIRALGAAVVSTSEGYVIYAVDQNSYKRVYCVNHENDDLEEELLIFVDNGGRVLNTIIEHVIYGEIVVDMHLNSRRQVKAFIQKTGQEDFTPLMALTNGNHYHTIEADSEQILDDIETELKARGWCE